MSGVSTTLVYLEKFSMASFVYALCKEMKYFLKHCAWERRANHTMTKILSYLIYQLLCMLNFLMFHWTQRNPATTTEPFQIRFIYVLNNKITKKKKKKKLSTSALCNMKNTLRPNKLEITWYVCEITYIALQIIGLPCLNTVILVRVACPLMQVMAVVNITDQCLTLFCCYNWHNISRDVNFGFCFVVIWFIQSVILDLACMFKPHQFGIISHAGNSNVVTSLFDIVSFVFKLKRGEKK